MTRSRSTTSGFVSLRGGDAPPRRPRPRRPPRSPPAARGTSAGPGARRRGRPRSGARITRRHLEPHRRALARARLDRERPAELARAAPPCDVSPSRRERSAGSSQSKPTPSSATGSDERAVARLERERRPARRRACRSAFWSASCAIRKTSASARGDEPRRALRSAARSRAGARGAARRRACAASSRAPPSRAPAAAARRRASAAPRAPRRELLQPLELRARLRRRRASSSVDAASAVSTTPKSFCATESCRSRASRFRSSTIESSRAALVEPRVLDRDAACAASISISCWSSSSNSPPPRFSREVEGADRCPRATTIGTPRNERMSGCCVAATSRWKRGSAWMSRRPVRLRRLEHRAEQAVRARQRAHRGDQLVAHPGGDELREGALAVGHAERRVPRARRARAPRGRASAGSARPRAPRRSPAPRRSSP